MNTPHSQGGRPGDLRGKRGFILTGISGSHTLFHAFQHSLLVLFPNIRESFALSNLQTTSISAVQEVVAGLIDLPGGVAMDLLKRYWGLVMTLCMGGFGIGWLVVGSAPGYVTVLSGMAIVAASSSLWHLPAMASLSNRFADRRGWTGLRMLSSGGTSFNADFAMETPDGRQLPGVSVFSKDGDGALRHFYTASAMMGDGHARGAGPA